MNDKVKEAEAEVSQETQAAPQAPIVQLTLQHIETMLNVIAVTQRRGVYKPEEMTTVGALYNDLALFLKQNQPPVEEEDATAEAGKESGEANAE